MGDACARGARSQRASDVSVRRINAFIDRDKSEGHKRSALLVAGLAGLGRINAETAGRLSDRFGLRLGHRSSWTHMIDRAAALASPGTVSGPNRYGPPGADLRRDTAGAPLPRDRRVEATDQDYTARMIAAEALART